MLIKRNAEDKQDKIQGKRVVHKMKRVICSVFLLEKRYKNDFPLFNEYKKLRYLFTRCRSFDDAQDAISRSFDKRLGQIMNNKMRKY